MVWNKTLLKRAVIGYCLVCNTVSYVHSQIPQSETNCNLQQNFFVLLLWMLVLTMYIPDDDNQSLFFE